jgi:hypothetical protein
MTRLCSGSLCSYTPQGGTILSPGRPALHASFMEALCVATHAETKQESAEVIVGAGRCHRDLVTGNEPGEEKSREGLTPPKD